MRLNSLQRNSARCLEWGAARLRIKPADAQHLVVLRLPMKRERSRCIAKLCKFTGKAGPGSIRWAYLFGDAADFEGGGGGNWLKGVIGGDLGHQGSGDQDESGLEVGEGLGEGNGVVGVDVGGGIGREGLEDDLLDGAVGVEDHAGDGVESAGAPVEERAGGRGDERGGVAEDLLEDGNFLAVVGRDVAVGEGWRVELTTRVGGGQGGEDPEDGGCGGQAEPKDAGPVGEIQGVDAVGDPNGDERGERGIGWGNVMRQAGLDATEGDDLHNGEDSEGAEVVEIRDAEGCVEGGGVEEDPRRGGEEDDSEIVPPGGKVAFVLMGDAAEDMKV